jgi:uncharacterized protein GlcG (DUF336 family)
MGSNDRGIVVSAHLEQKAPTASAGDVLRRTLFVTVTFHSKQGEEYMLTINRLSLGEAQVLVEGARDKSNEIGIPMCIAVSDESGNLIAFERMDGGKISSISIAIDKAFTAAVARKGTHVYNDLCVPGEPTFGIHVSNGGHFCVIGGGLPVYVEDEIVGGIGISSGTAAEDLVVAEAAVGYFDAWRSSVDGSS